MLKKIIITLYVITALFLMGFTPQNNQNNSQEEPTEMTWEVLANISKSMRVMANYSNTIKESLHGKKIKISGYVIPIDSKSYVLSKNMYSHCFFCSTNAGIETIMGIQFKNKPPRLKTDTFITLEGTFFYNDKNKDGWTFYVQNAVITNKK
ncbi:DUF3299 domain-containing protein [Flavobacterium dauae]|uniref:DUF3299 domain-containing protein n=1 Tax=Flavobacterium dauae TaxID=1563479 RepID=UPI00101D0EB1|nr:DUF3299 domain-containing protein [Flavobacterium dauae]WLD23377.1 DUF3299 domain-containing protein [Flavobacterium dauae]